MTIVAWDGKTFAADKQSTIGGLKRKLSKIHKLDNGHLVAATGTTVDCIEYVKWYKKVCAATEDERVFFPTWTGNDKPWLMVVTPWKGIYLYTGCDTYIDYSENDIFAVGSGSEYAMGAMRAGATAKEAVLIASEFDTHCGMGVDSIELEVEEDTVKVTMAADEAKKAVKKKPKVKDTA